jgi:hypothetical protein
LPIFYFYRQFPSPWSSVVFLVNLSTKRYRMNTQLVAEIYEQEIMHQSENAFCSKTHDVSHRDHFSILKYLHITINISSTIYLYFLHMYTYSFWTSYY